MRAATCTKELGRHSVGQCGIATDEDLSRIASIRALTNLSQSATPDTPRE